MIRAFQAQGVLIVDDDAKIEDVRRLLNYALAEVGVGASRKMGFGRGQVEVLEPMNGA